MASRPEALQIERDVPEARFVHRCDDLFPAGHDVLEPIRADLDPGEVLPLITHPDVSCQPQRLKGLLRLLDPFERLLGNRHTVGQS